MNESNSPDSFLAIGFRWVDGGHGWRMNEWMNHHHQSSLSIHHSIIIIAGHRPAVTVTVTVTINDCSEWVVDGYVLYLWTGTDVCMDNIMLCPKGDGNAALWNERNDRLGRGWRFRSRRIFWRMSTVHYLRVRTVLLQCSSSSAYGTVRPTVRTKINSVWTEIMFALFLENLFVKTKVLLLTSILAAIKRAPDEK